MAHGRMHRWPYYDIRPASGKGCLRWQQQYAMRKSTPCGTSVQSEPKALHVTPLLTHAKTQAHLQQQDAERGGAKSGGQLATLAQQLQHKGRAGQGQRRADHDCLIHAAHGCQLWRRMEDLCTGTCASPVSTMHVARSHCQHACMKSGSFLSVKHCKTVQM